MEAIRSTASLGALARAARLGQGWSQQQAADEAGVSRRFVNMLESGEHRNAELWRVLALLEALGVELSGSIPVAPETVQAAAQVGDARTSTPEDLGEGTRADGFDLDAHLAGFRDGGA